MNEKIKQLAEQAGFHVADGKIYIPTTSEDITECQKKFAELIVQECVGRIQLHNRMDEVTEQWVYDNLVSDVKEHFGVE